MKVSWEKFHSDDYLGEYYDHIGRENEKLLEFLTAAYRLMPSGLAMLDVGTGPTIYQLIAASGKVSSISCGEFLGQNLRKVHAWVQSLPESFDWSLFTERILLLEGEKATSAKIAERELLTRKKIIDIFQLDLKRPVDKRLVCAYDLLSVQFVPESITSSIDEYSKCLRSISSMLKPRGFLLMSAIKSAKSYKVGKDFFPAVSLNETTLNAHLVEAGFLEEPILSTSVNAENQGSQKYAGLMFLLTQKR